MVNTNFNAASLLTDYNFRFKDGVAFMNKSRYLPIGTVLEEKSGLVSKINIDDIMVQTMLCGDNTGSLHVGNPKTKKYKASLL